MVPEKSFSREFRRRFLEPLDGEWFREGLVIASASRRSTSKTLPLLAQKFPGVNWDLLARREESNFRTFYPVRQPLGGLRLLLKSRDRYEVVILFHDRSDRELRMQSWLALLLLRPRRFFVVVEGGKGMWLSVENRAELRDYFSRAAWFYDRFFPGPAHFLRVFKRWLQPRLVRWSAWLEPVVSPVFRALGWLFRLPVALGSYLVRGARLAGGAVCFLFALVLIAFFRLLYDTHYCRFRFFGKKASLHSERKFDR
ncbi:MAG: hypothetical protein WD696_15825 [Bryobacteraceae bacterium]